MKKLTYIDFDNNEYLLHDYVIDNKFKRIEIHKNPPFQTSYHIQVKIDLVLEALHQLKRDQKVFVQYAYANQDDKETGWRYFVFT
jgi:hypothetical protein